MWLYDLFEPLRESQSIRPDSPYHQASQQAIRCEKALRALLGGEALEALDEFSRAEGLAAGLESAESFELGFKLAFRLLCQAASASENFAYEHFL